MSLERYSNIRTIRDTPGLSRGIDWFERDQAALKLTQLTSRPDETPVVEMHIYTPTNEVYLGGGPITDFVIQGDKLYIDYASAFASYDIKRGFFKVNINVYYNIVGTYEFPELKVTELSTDNTELLLTEFAPRADEPTTNIVAEFLEEYSNPFDRDFALNFGENRLLRMINYKSYFNDSTMAVKLYNSPTDGDIEPLSRCQIVEIVSDSYIDNISLDQLAPTKPPQSLRGPNFEIETGYTTSTETDFKNWNQLLGSNVNTSQKIIDSVFSGSLAGVELGIDFTGYNNFIFYSSANSRLANFKQKIERLEYYDNRLNTLNSTSGSSSGSLSTNINNVQKRKDALIGTFDSFEKWLYNEPTASLFTHGTTGSPLTPDEDSEVFILSPWPKRIVNGTNLIYASTSSIAENWFLSASNAATTYDENNPNQLLKTIPEYIRLDANNSEYETFVNMIGQHFDILYSYANALTEKVYVKEEHPKLGIDKDVLNDIAKSQGWQLTNGNQASQLWQYALGTNESGTYAQSGSLFSVPNEQITSEVWRRIINNLPYILKSRGTIQSIKSLLNIYGIPQTLLSVREYGGPKVSNEWPVLTEDRYSYAMQFNSGSSLSYSSLHVSASLPNWGRVVTTPNVVPVQTREFRFRPYQTGSMILYSQVNSSGDPLVQMAIEHTGSYSGSAFFGRLNLSFGSGSGTSPITASTDWLPIFDGDFWNISYGWETTGDHFNTGSNSDTTYRIRIGHASDYIKGKVSHTGSIAITPTNTDHYLTWSDPATLNANVVYIGGNTGSGDELNVNDYLTTLMGAMPGTYSGSMQEYREYLEYISLDAWNDHVLNPTSYVSGISATSSFDTLVRHYTLGSETVGFDLSTDGTIISSSHPNQSANDFTTNNAYSTNAVTDGFENPNDSQRGNFIPVEETYYVRGVSVGANNPRSQKIRLEENSLVRRLSPVKSGERSSFDNAPLDSHKLGLFYSFADQVNKDIFNHTGRIELDDYIGDPDDEYEVAYEDLKRFASQYWKKFTNASDINSYNRIFSQFDFSIFNQIKQTLPERVDEATGLLIEPNVIERNKVQITKPIGVDNPQYDVVITQQEPTWSADYINYEGVVTRDETAVLILSSSYDVEYSDTAYVVQNSSSMNYCTIETLPVDELVSFTASLNDINYTADDGINLDYGNQKVLLDPTSVKTPTDWSNSSNTSKYDILDNIYPSSGGAADSEYRLNTALYGTGSFSTSVSDTAKQVRFKLDTEVQYDVKLNVESDIIVRPTTSTTSFRTNVVAIVAELEDALDINSRIIKIYDQKEVSQVNTNASEKKHVFNFKSILVPAYTSLVLIYQVSAGYGNNGVLVSGSITSDGVQSESDTTIRFRVSSSNASPSGPYPGDTSTSPMLFFSESQALGVPVFVSGTLPSGQHCFIDASDIPTDIAPVDIIRQSRITLADGYQVSAFLEGTETELIFISSTGSAVPPVTGSGPFNTAFESGSTSEKMSLVRHAALVTTEEVCHSVKQHYIEDCRQSDIYETPVFYYSGSSTIANKRERDNDGFLSQSLGLYYSRSLDVACYRDDFFESHERAFYTGTQLSAPGVNLPTVDGVLNGAPVIEIFEVNPNQLFYNTTPKQPGPGNTLDPGNLTVR